MSTGRWKDVVVDKVVFTVPHDLEFVKKLGSGAYGSVAKFRRGPEELAVKKITNAFHDLIDGKRVLREIKLLRAFEHDNIVSILDMYPPENTEFEDIYIVMDVMETDLHRVIYSKQTLNEEHHQYFTYQILRGLLYLHSAEVIHRDLKPPNILVNKNCDLKICDFGLARGFIAEREEELTDYVVTRWYRAPEVVLIGSLYTKAVDVWSVGCILCELVGRKPIFTGKDSLDQLKKIVTIVGSPGEEDLEWLPKKGAAREYMTRKIPRCVRQPWQQIYPKISDDAVGAIEAMLCFNPERRVDVSHTISLPYFSTLHMPSDEPVASAPVDWAFDKFTPTKRLLQNYIYAECAKFYPQILARDKAFLKSTGIDNIL